MIICPNCKQEIDDDSHYCDQCGQALLFCEHCGRVGLGHRCTHCGNLMISADQRDEQVSRRNESTSVASLMGGATIPTSPSVGNVAPDSQNMQKIPGVPQLTLYNANLNMRLIGQNGAIIGRRQGIYQQYFADSKFVSGVHAQLVYNVNTGWSVVDKHSSNGTKLNQRPLQPDVPMSLKNGDILTIANVNLQVSIV